MMKKEKRKRERCVWLGGRVESNFGGPNCFLAFPTKSFLSNLERKLEGLYFNPINYIFAPLFITLNMKNLGNCWHLTLLQPT